MDVIEVVRPEFLSNFNHKELIWVHSDWLNIFGKKISASRWQYDTWVCNFPNQDSSIITKNKSSKYFNWLLEINNNNDPLIIYKVIFDIINTIFITIIIVTCYYRTFISNAKLDLFLLSDYGIKAWMFCMESFIILLRNDFDLHFKKLTGKHIFYIK